MRRGQKPGEAPAKIRAYLIANPGASTSEVARIVGSSPVTVTSVRREMGMESPYGSPAHRLRTDLAAAERAQADAQSKLDAATRLVRTLRAAIDAIEMIEADHA
jgi:hypothetical protein